MFQRFVAANLVFIFTFTTVVWSAPGISTSQTPFQISRNEVKFPSIVQDLDLPRSIGSIKERYAADVFADNKDSAAHGVNYSPVIFHIQDAHANYEAQTNIKKILQYVTEQTGADIIFLEGAMQQLNPNLIRFFSDDSYNNKIADLLTKDGVIGGTELFLLEQLQDPKQNKKIAAYGVENAKLYRRNIETYRKVLSQRGASDSFLDSLKLKLLQLGSNTFNKKLCSFFKEWLFYQDVPSEILRHLDTLQKYAKQELDLDLADARSQLEWPQLVRILKLKEVEVALNQKQAQAEKEKLLAWMKVKNVDAGIIQEIKNLETKIAKKKHESLDSRAFLEKLFDKLAGQGFSFKNYPHYSKMLGFHLLRDEIKVDDLMKETERLTDQVLAKLAGEEAEKDLVLLYKDFLLLKKLLHLEIIFDDFRNFQLRANEIEPSAMLRRIKKMDATPVTGGPSSRQKVNLSSFNTSKLQALFLLSRFFYLDARKREEMIFQNMFRKMQAEGKSKAILVTGGFHCPGLAEHFRRQNISYVSIMPHISEITDNKTYINIMTQQADYWTRRSYAHQPSGIDPGLRWDLGRRWGRDYSGRKFVNVASVVPLRMKDTGLSLRDIVAEINAGPAAQAEGGPLFDRPNRNGAYGWIEFDRRPIQTQKGWLALGATGPTTVRNPRGHLVSRAVSKRQAQKTERRRSEARTTKQQLEAVVQVTFPGKFTDVRVKVVQGMNQNVIAAEIGIMSPAITEDDLDALSGVLRDGPLKFKTLRKGVFRSADGSTVTGRGIRIERMTDDEIATMPVETRAASEAAQLKPKMRLKSKIIIAGVVAAILGIVFWIFMDRMTNKKFAGEKTKIKRPQTVRAYVPVHLGKENYQQPESPAAQKIKFEEDQPTIQPGVEVHAWNLERPIRIAPGSGTELIVGFYVAFPGDMKVWNDERLIKTAVEKLRETALSIELKGDKGALAVVPVTLTTDSIRELLNPDTIERVRAKGFLPVSIKLDDKLIPGLFDYTAKQLNVSRVESKESVKLSVRISEVRSEARNPLVIVGALSLVAGGVIGAAVVRSWQNRRQRRIEGERAWIQLLYGPALDIVAAEVRTQVYKHYRTDGQPTLDIYAERLPQEWLEGITSATSPDAYNVTLQPVRKGDKRAMVRVIDPSVSTFHITQKGVAPDVAYDYASRYFAINISFNAPARSEARMTVDEAKVEAGRTLSRLGMPSVEPEATEVAALNTHQFLNDTRAGLANEIDGLAQKVVDLASHLSQKGFTTLPGQYLRYAELLRDTAKHLRSEARQLMANVRPKVEEYLAVPETENAAAEAVLNGMLADYDKYQLSQGDAQILRTHRNHRVVMRHLEEGKQTGNYQLRTILDVQATHMEEPVKQFLQGHEDEHFPGIDIDEVRSMGATHPAGTKLTGNTLPILTIMNRAMQKFPRLTPEEIAAGKKRVWVMSLDAGSGTRAGLFTLASGGVKGPILLLGKNLAPQAIDQAKVLAEGLPPGEWFIVAPSDNILLAAPEYMPGRGLFLYTPKAQIFPDLDENGVPIQPTVISERELNKYTQLGHAMVDNTNQAEKFVEKPGEKNPYNPHQVFEEMLRYGVVKWYLEQYGHAPGSYIDAKEAFFSEFRQFVNLDKLTHSKQEHFLQELVFLPYLLPGQNGLDVWNHLFENSAGQNFRGGSEIDKTIWLEMRRSAQRAVMPSPRLKALLESLFEHIRHSSLNTFYFAVNRETAEAFLDPVRGYAQPRVTPDGGTYYQVKGGSAGGKRLDWSGHVLTPMTMSLTDWMRRWEIPDDEWRQKTYKTKKAANPAVKLEDIAINSFQNDWPERQEWEQLWHIAQHVKNTAHGLSSAPTGRFWFDTGEVVEIERLYRMAVSKEKVWDRLFIRATFGLPLFENEVFAEFTGEGKVEFEDPENALLIHSRIRVPKGVTLKIGSGVVMDHVDLDIEVEPGQTEVRIPPGAILSGVKMKGKIKGAGENHVFYHFFGDIMNFERTPRFATTIFLNENPKLPANMRGIPVTLRHDAKINPSSTDPLYIRLPDGTKVSNLSLGGDFFSGNRVYDFAPNFGALVDLIRARREQRSEARVNRREVLAAAIGAGALGLLGSAVGIGFWLGSRRGVPVEQRPEIIVPAQSETPEAQARSAADAYRPKVSEKFQPDFDNPREYTQDDMDELAREVIGTMEAQLGEKFDRKKLAHVEALTNFFHLGPDPVLDRYSAISGPKYFTEIETRKDSNYYPQDESQLVIAFYWRSLVRLYALHRKIFVVNDKQRKNYEITPGKVSDVAQESMFYKERGGNHAVADARKRYSAVYLNKYLDTKGLPESEAPASLKARSEARNMNAADRHDETIRQIWKEFGETRQLSGQTVLNLTRLGFRVAVGNAETLSDFASHLREDPEFRAYFTRDMSVEFIPSNLYHALNNLLLHGRNYGVLLIHAVPGHREQDSIFEFILMDLGPGFVNESDARISITDAVTGADSRIGRQYGGLDEFARLSSGFEIDEFHKRMDGTTEGFRYINDRSNLPTETSIEGEPTVSSGVLIRVQNYAYGIARRSEVRSWLKKVVGPAVVLTAALAIGYFAGNRAPAPVQQQQPDIVAKAPEQDRAPPVEPQKLPEAKKEQPKRGTTKQETPKQETPKQETPKQETPKKEEPKQEAKPAPFKADAALTENFQGILEGVGTYILEAGIHEPTGNPLDHVQVDAKGNVVEKGTYGAPSKPGVSLPTLLYIAEGNPLAKKMKVTPEKALQLMTKNLQSLRTFQKDYEGTEVKFGLYPWWDLRNDGTMRLTLYGGRKMIPSLDNGQLTFALVAISGAFADAPNGSAKAKARDLAQEILKNQHYEKMVDPRTGRLFAEWNLDDNKGTAGGAEVNGWTEWQIPMAYAYLNGDITKEAWLSQVNETFIWESPAGQIDVPQMYRFSAPEHWIIQYFPKTIMKSKLAPLYRNLVYMHYVWATEHNVPGALGVEYRVDGKYVGAGYPIEEKDGVIKLSGYPTKNFKRKYSVSGDDTNLATPYGTGMDMLIAPNTAPWLDYLAKQPGVKTRMGLVTSFTRKGGASRMYTGDNFTTANTVMEWALIQNNQPGGVNDAIVNHFAKTWSVTNEEAEKRIIAAFDAIAEVILKRLGREKFLEVDASKIPMPPAKGDFSVEAGKEAVMTEKTIMLSERLQLGHWHGKNVSTPKEYAEWGDKGQPWVMKGGEIVADFNIPRERGNDYAFIGTYVAPESPLAAKDKTGKAKKIQSVSFWVPVDSKERYQLEIKSGNREIADRVNVNTNVEGQLSTDKKWKRIVLEFSPNAAAIDEKLPFSYIAISTNITLTGGKQEGRIHLKDIQLHVDPVAAVRKQRVEGPSTTKAPEKKEGTAKTGQAAFENAQKNINDMKQFVRDLMDEKGYEVKNEGFVSGLAQWYVKPGVEGANPDLKVTRPLSELKGEIDQKTQEWLDKGFIQKKSQSEEKPSEKREEKKETSKKADKTAFEKAQNNLDDMKQFMRDYLAEKGYEKVQEGWISGVAQWYLKPGVEGVNEGVTGTRPFSEFEGEMKQKENKGELKKKEGVEEEQEEEQQSSLDRDVKEYFVFLQDKSMYPPERRTEMALELVHDEDLLVRNEAVRDLAYAEGPLAPLALQTLLVAAQDKDARVRETAIKSLGIGMGIPVFDQIAEIVRPYQNQRDPYATAVKALEIDIDLYDTDWRRLISRDRRDPEHITDKRNALGSLLAFQSGLNQANEVMLRAETRHPTVQQLAVAMSFADVRETHARSEMRKWVIAAGVAVVLTAGIGYWVSTGIKQADQIKVVDQIDAAAEERAFNNAQSDLAAMKKFVTDYLARRGYTIKNQGWLSGFAPWYLAPGVSGARAKVLRPFSEFEGEMSEKLETWVNNGALSKRSEVRKSTVFITGAALILAGIGYWWGNLHKQAPQNQPVVVQKAPEKIEQQPEPKVEKKEEPKIDEQAEFGKAQKDLDSMKTFVTGYLERKGYRIANQGWLSGFAPWYLAPEAEGQRAGVLRPFSEFEQEMRERLQRWVDDGLLEKVGRVEQREEKPSQPEKQTKVDEKAEFAKAQKDLDSMKTFVTGYLERKGYAISNQGWLSGFAPWYLAPDAEGQRAGVLRPFSEFEQEFREKIQQWLDEGALEKRSEARLTFVEAALAANLTKTEAVYLKEAALVNGFQADKMSPAEQRYTARVLTALQQNGVFAEGDEAAKTRILGEIVASVAGKNTQTILAEYEAALAKRSETRRPMSDYPVLQAAYDEASRAIPLALTGSSEVVDVDKINAQLHSTVNRTQTFELTNADNISQKILVVVYPKRFGASDGPDENRWTINASRSFVHEDETYIVEIYRTRSEARLSDAEIAQIVTELRSQNPDIAGSDIYDHLLLGEDQGVYSRIVEEIFPRYNLPGNQQTLTNSITSGHVTMAQMRENIDRITTAVDKANPYRSEARRPMSEYPVLQAAYQASYTIATSLRGNTPAIDPEQLDVQLLTTNYRMKTFEVTNRANAKRILVVIYPVHYQSTLTDVVRQQQERPDPRQWSSEELAVFFVHDGEQHAAQVYRLRSEARAEIPHTDFDEMPLRDITGFIDAEPYDTVREELTVLRIRTVRDLIKYIADHPADYLSQFSDPGDQQLIFDLLLYAMKHQGRPVIEALIDQVGDFITVRALGGILINYLGTAWDVHVQRLDFEEEMHIQNFAQIRDMIERNREAARATLLRYFKTEQIADFIIDLVTARSEARVNRFKFETLEDRRLMAVDTPLLDHAPAFVGPAVAGQSAASKVSPITAEAEGAFPLDPNRVDTNRDGKRTPIDVVRVINELNENGSHVVGPNDPKKILDVDDDGVIAPPDAAFAVNWLSSWRDSDNLQYATRIIRAPELGEDVYVAQVFDFRTNTVVEVGRTGPILGAIDSVTVSPNSHFAVVAYAGAKRGAAVKVVNIEGSRTGIQESEEVEGAFVFAAFDGKNITVKTRIKMVTFNGETLKAMDQPAFISNPNYAITEYSSDGQYPYSNFGGTFYAVTNQETGQVFDRAFFVKSLSSYYSYYGYSSSTSIIEVTQPAVSNAPTVVAMQIVSMMYSSGPTNSISPSLKLWQLKPEAKPATFSLNDILGEKGTITMNPASTFVGNTNIIEVIYKAANGENRVAYVDAVTGKRVDSARSEARRVSVSPRELVGTYGDRLNAYRSNRAMGEAAADWGSEKIGELLATQDTVRIMFAAAPSQVQTIKALVKYLAKLPRKDLRRLEIFHMDEFAGFPLGHEVSFRTWLTDNLINPLIALGVRRSDLNINLLDLDGIHPRDRKGLERAARTYERKLGKAPLDIVFGGYGENGHVAFNDPPAKFRTKRKVIVVDPAADPVNVRQQMAAYPKYFKSKADIPYAVTVTLPPIHEAKYIIMSVPKFAKAEALRLIHSHKGWPVNAPKNKMVPGTFFNDLPADRIQVFTNVPGTRKLPRRHLMTRPARRSEARLPAGQYPLGGTLAAALRNEIESVAKYIGSGPIRILFKGGRVVTVNVADRKAVSVESRPVEIEVGEVGAAGGTGDLLAEWIVVHELERQFPTTRLANFTVEQRLTVQRNDIVIREVGAEGALETLAEAKGQPVIEQNKTYDLVADIWAFAQEVVQRVQGEPLSKLSLSIAAGSSREREFRSSLGNVETNGYLENAPVIPVSVRNALRDQNINNIIFDAPVLDQLKHEGLAWAIAKSIAAVLAQQKSVAKDAEAVQGSVRRGLSEITYTRDINGYFFRVKAAFPELNNILREEAILAPVTLLKKDAAGVISVDEDATRRHLQFTKDMGATAMLALAATGEFADMSPALRRQVLLAQVRIGKELGYRVIANITGENMSEMAGQIIASSRNEDPNLNADAYIWAPLHFLPPDKILEASRDLRQFLKRNVVDKPILYYDNPVMAGVHQGPGTGIDIPAKIVAQATEEGLIEGIKATTSRGAAFDYLASGHPYLYIGMDTNIEAGMLEGARGSIGGLVNVLRQERELVTAVNPADRTARQNEIIQLAPTITAGGEVASGIKYALLVLGVIGEENTFVVSPGAELTDQQKEAIRGIESSMGPVRSEARRDLVLSEFKNYVTDTLDQGYPDLHGTWKITHEGNDVNPVRVSVVFSYKGRVPANRWSKIDEQLTNLAQELTGRFDSYFYQYVVTLPQDKTQIDGTYQVELILRGPNDKRSEARLQRQPDLDVAARRIQRLLERGELLYKKIQSDTDPDTLTQNSRILAQAQAEYQAAIGKYESLKARMTQPAANETIEDVRRRLTELDQKLGSLVKSAKDRLAWFSRMTDFRNAFVRTVNDGPDGEPVLGDPLHWVEAHEKGTRHATAQIIIMTYDGEVLVQKRPDGKIDTSAAGHVRIEDASFLDAAMRITRKETDLPGLMREQFIPLNGMVGTDKKGTADFQGTPYYDTNGVFRSRTATEPSNWETSKFYLLILNPEQTRALRRISEDKTRLHSFGFIPLRAAETEQAPDQTGLIEKIQAENLHGEELVRHLNPYASTILQFFRHPKNTALLERVLMAQYLNILRTAKNLEVLQAAARGISRISGSAVPKIATTPARLKKDNGPGVIIFDVDRTLADRNGRLTQDMRKQIRALLKLGYRVVIITGQAINVQYPRLVADIMMKEGEGATEIGGAELLDDKDLDNLVIYAGEGTQKFVFVEGKIHEVEDFRKGALADKEIKEQVQHLAKRTLEDVAAGRLSEEEKTLVKNKSLLSQLAQVLKQAHDKKEGPQWYDRDTILAFKYDAFKGLSNARELREVLKAILRHRLQKQGEGAAERQTVGPRKPGIGDVDVALSGATTLAFVPYGIDKSLPMADILEKVSPESAAYFGDEFARSGNDAAIARYKLKKSNRAEALTVVSVGVENKKPLQPQGTRWIGEGPSAVQRSLKQLVALAEAAPVQERHLVFSKWKKELDKLERDAKRSLRKAVQGTAGRARRAASEARVHPSVGDLNTANAFGLAENNGGADTKAAFEAAKAGDLLEARVAAQRALDSTDWEKVTPAKAGPVQESLRRALAKLPKPRSEVRAGGTAVPNVVNGFVREIVQYADGKRVTIDVQLMGSLAGQITFEKGAVVSEIKDLGAAIQPQLNSEVTYDVNASDHTIFIHEIDARFTVPADSAAAVGRILRRGDEAVPVSPVVTSAEPSGQPKRPTRSESRLNAAQQQLVLEDYFERTYTRVSLPAVIATAQDVAEKTVSEEHRVRREVLEALIDAIAPVIAKEKEFNLGEYRAEIDKAIAEVEAFFADGKLVMENTGIPVEAILTTTGDLSKRKALVLAALPFLIARAHKDDKTGQYDQTLLLGGDNAAAIKQAVYAKNNNLTEAEKSLVSQVIKFAKGSVSFRDLVYDMLLKQQKSSRPAAIVSSATQGESSQIAEMIQQILSTIDSPEDLNIPDMTPVERAEAYAVRTMLFMDLAGVLQVKAAKLRKDPAARMEIMRLIKMYFEKYPKINVTFNEDGSLNVTLKSVSAQIATFRAQAAVDHSA